MDSSGLTPHWAGVSSLDAASGFRNYHHQAPTSAFYLPAGAHTRGPPTSARPTGQQPPSAPGYAYAVAGPLGFPADQYPAPTQPALYRRGVPAPPASSAFAFQPAPQGPQLPTAAAPTQPTALLGRPQPLSVTMPFAPAVHAAAADSGSLADDDLADKRGKPTASFKRRMRRKARRIHLMQEQFQQIVSHCDVPLEEEEGSSEETDEARSFQRVVDRADDDEDAGDHSSSEGSERCYQYSGSAVSDEAGLAESISNPLSGFEAQLSTASCATAATSRSSPTPSLGQAIEDASLTANVGPCEPISPDTGFGPVFSKQASCVSDGGILAGVSCTAQIAVFPVNGLTSDQRFLQTFKLGLQYHAHWMTAVSREIRF
eukprot:m.337424 g.337424  ORF g.337424 m.337424 type:complete len:373 (+) comp55721_c0_seq1:423-1541(+)